LSGGKLAVVAARVDLSDLATACDEAWALVKSTPGYLSEKEARFLMIAAALTPAHGRILEIGSFKGRSTVGLAYIAKRYDLGKIVSVDPHTSPSATDPDLRGAPSSLQDFFENLRGTGMLDAVEAKVMFSHEVAREWREPIRLLWIDGDHTYAGALADLRLFQPHLAPGAVIAMHDVLGTHYGSLRVFVEEVLGSDAFGAAGYCGSIGWAQYRPDAGSNLEHRLRRELLAFPARKIIPIAQSDRGLVGWNKWRYKFWRPLAPHGSLNARRWAKRVSLGA
jgi:predicted O-methyltransferase YrrM